MTAGTIAAPAPTPAALGARAMLEEISQRLSASIDRYKTEKEETTMTETKTDNEYLLWVDVETTGLDLEANSLLEIELRLTDMSGEEVDSFHQVISPRDGVRFDAVALRMHAANNLLKDACDSDHDQWIAIEMLRDWMGDDTHPCETDTWHLTGSSVHFDFAWLKCNGVDLDRYTQIHHRRLDLSDIRILLDAIDPQLMKDITDGIPQTDHRTGSCLDRDIETYQHLLDLPDYLQDSKLDTEASK